MKTFAHHSLRLLLCLAIGVVMQLHAATAKDILGEYSIDVNAAWEALKKSPEAAALPPGFIDAMKPDFFKKMGESSVNITADKVIMDMGSEGKKETSYKVLGIDGDKIMTESTGEDGKTSKGTITIKGDTLHLDSGIESDPTFVLKRKAAK